MKEIWKSIENGFYEVSNLGRVRRAKPGPGTYIGRLIKLTVRSDGYVSVELFGRPNRKHYFLHQLVAMAFIGPCPRGKEVNHEDGNKQNCTWDNLTYMTRKENHDHAKKLGLWHPGHFSGSSHWKAKLTEKKVVRMRKLYETGRYTQMDLSRKFGVVNQVVSSIVTRKAWAHVA